MKTLILLGFLLFACTNSKVEPVKTATRSTCGETELEALATWKLENGKELVVCKYGTSGKISGDEFAGWINIFQKNGSAFTPLLPEVSSELESEFYSFKLKKEDGSKIRVTRLIRSTMEGAGGTDTLATEAFIDCSEAVCKLGKESCLTPITQTVDEEAIKQLEEVRSGKLKVTELGSYDVVVGNVIASAIAGDKRALKVLADKKKLQLDGAAAETYVDGMHVVSQLQQLGCLKR